LDNKIIVYITDKLVLNIVSNAINDNVLRFMIDF